MLHISILIENSACSDDFACEHGLSFLLESDGACVLFDTGQSPAFLDNAAKMGHDLSGVTEIVLSHGHYDHTGGLAAALDHLRERRGGKDLPRLYAHPDVLLERRRPPSHPKGEKDICIPEDSRNALTAWPLLFSRDPVHIRDDIVFLGEIPRKHPDLCALVGEARTPYGYKRDTIPDDTALAYITSKGLIVVAGCSHSGIVNIIDHAKTVTGVNTVHALYGGLHCKDMPDDVLRRTIEALERENIQEICAFHCTGDALDAFPGHVRLAAGQSRTVV